MPEGDSVLQLSERMQWMTGRTVTHCDIRVPRHATEDLTGRTVRRVWPYGKHFFIDAGGRILHTHLRMEGVWSVHRVGDRWRRPAHTARVVLRFPPQHPGGPAIETVGHSLGFVRLFDADEYPQVIGHLGPDILDPGWGDDGRAEAVRRLLARPGRPVGAALLDQRVVAGIGNEYRAEVCFLAGVDPRDSVAAVGEERAVRALDLARRTMWDNRSEPRRVFTGDRRPGWGNWVFGRADRPCRRCGTTLRTGVLGGADAGGDDGELERIIWLCPHCQPRRGG
ncbi:DNA-formamidopyrimidine glycosylase family protein [Corynebacterium bovis]|uniref:DNA-formamidopyrimidine glycosylase family protein n=1 Tax=Corynebacterium bovis TaxID=36808 RepID=UPI0031398F95